jgi:NAD-dependent dihydropyrimidine dehydrogenase PreA subunit
MLRIGPAREKLRWFPTINYDLCISDLGCLIFCPYDVFDWEEETGRPIVARPYNCVPGCDMCARDCATGAVTLPSKKQMRAIIRKLRAELRQASALPGG